MAFTGFYMMDRQFLDTLSRDSTLTAAELRIVLALAADTRLPGEAVEAGVLTLAARLGMGRSTVKRARTGLIAKKHLLVSGAGKDNALLLRLADQGGSTNGPGKGPSMDPPAGVIHIKETETKTASFSPRPAPSRQSRTQSEWDPYENYEMTDGEIARFNDMFADLGKELQT